MTAVKTRSAFRTEADTKATMTSGTMLPSSGTGVESGLYPNAFPLATLFRSEAVSGPAVRYYVLGGATADLVAEGDLKPDAGVSITPKDVLLLEVATMFRFSDELSDDARLPDPFLQSELVSGASSPRRTRRSWPTFDTTSGVLTGHRGHRRRPGRGGRRHRRAGGASTARPRPPWW